MREELLDRIQRTIRRHRLFASRARLIVAVSGGADSVALLHLLARLRTAWRLTLHVAHLDHGLRPDASRDAAFVQSLADRSQLPVTMERRDVAAECRRAGWSLEDGARRIRYQFLAEVARHQSASCVALAHTADDQAETVLMRLVRGTGLLGLGAMPSKRPLGDGWIVRPLLEVWRKDILAYVQDAELTYCEDPSNQDRRFVRNRIRHELLPLLARHYNPNIKGALTQLAEQSRWDYAYLQDAAGRQWRRTARVHPPAQIAMRIEVFWHQPKAIQRQLVRRAIQQLRCDEGRLEFRHWLEIERMFHERPIGTLLDLPGGVQVVRESDRVVFQSVLLAPSSSLAVY